MRKIKIIFIILVLIIIITIGSYTPYFTVPDYFQSQLNISKNQFILGEWDFFLNILFSLIILSGHILAAYGTLTIIITGGYWSMSKKVIHSAGVIYLICGIVLFILDLTRILHSVDTASLIYLIIVDFILILFGLITLIISDISQTGYILKKENDLTI